MKTDRLLGIITALVSNKRVKARELAEKFEVSVRTIHRDIEDICRAGIPVVTYPGGDGGIGIAEGFTLDKSALSQEEMKSILLGLKSLDSIMSDSRIRALLRKLSPEPDSFVALKDDMLIDLTSYYKGSIAPKISALRTAIAEKRAVSFQYFAKNGTVRRTVEPYFIAFKWSSWYLFAYCRLRGDFRLFKLNRMTDLELTDEHYVFREVSGRQLDLEAFYTDPQAVKHATLLLDRSIEYAAVDEYGAGSYEIMDENTIKTRWDYVNEAEMVGRILSLGSKAKVLAPEELAAAVKREAAKIVERYL